MDKIKINEKDYVSEEEYNKLKQELENIRNKGFKNAGEFEIALFDEANVIGVGSFKIQSDDYKFSNISISLLKRAIKICEEVTYFDKQGKKRDYVTIGIHNDYPLLVGGLNQNKKLFSGVIIAPRVFNEGD